MPTLKRPDAEIYYEEYGAGFPVLCFAPGGARSSIEFWHRWRKDGGYTDDAVFIDPTLELAPHFRVIVMDQRNAGKSVARVSPDQGWHTFAADHLALMDSLGHSTFHVVGMCIGGSFDLKLCEIAPQRIASAVVWQTIGRSPENTPTTGENFNAWAKDLVEKRPEVDPAALAAIRDRMYKRDFVFSVRREMVKSLRVPLFILEGDDLPHPTIVSKELAELAPKADYWSGWKRQLDEQRRRIVAFLKAHTPH